MAKYMVYNIHNMIYEKIKSFKNNILNIISSNFKIKKFQI